MKLLLASLLMLVFVASAGAADSLILTAIDGYAPNLASLSEDVPVTDSLGSYSDSSLNYTGNDGVVRVEIREYADTRWLPHDMERQFRHTASIELLGKRTGNAAIKSFAGGTALCLAELTENCRWVSGNRAVRVSGKAPDGVIGAYMALLPPTYAEFSADAAWVVAEMERLLAAAAVRLDRAVQGGAPADVLLWVQRELNEFLLYRSSYYDVDSAGDKVLISKALHDNDLSILHTKLAEYSAWLGQQ